MSGDEGYPPPGWGPPPPGWGPPPPGPGWGPPPPGSPQPGQPYPGQADPGGPYPGQQYPGQPYPYPYPYPGAAYGAPGWGAPDAPRPGIVPLRPLGVGEILDGSLQAIRRNPRSMLGLPAIVAGVFFVLLALIRLVPAAGIQRLDDLTANGSTSVRSSLDLAGVVGALIGLGVTVLLVGVLAAVAITATQSCLTWIVAQAVLGRRQTIGDAWRAVRGRLLRLIGVVVVQGLAGALTYLVIGGVAAGAIVGIAFGLHGATRVILIVVVALLALCALVYVAVLLYTRWVLAPAVLLLGDRFPVPTGRPGSGVFGSLRGSWQLVRGSSWRVLGITILVSLIAQVVSGIISVPASLVAALIGAAGGETGNGFAATFGAGLISAFGSVVGLMLALPFTVSGITLVYLDQRMRREGLDIAVGLQAPPR